MFKDFGYYDVILFKCIIQEMFELLIKKSGENYCCCYKLFFVILLDYIILDELYLMLRIIDILLENLIEDVMQWDDKESFFFIIKRLVEKLEYF